MIKQQNNTQITDLTDSFFQTAVCRNCGAALHAKFCGSCGQKKAERFGMNHLGKEAWEKIRWFETEMVKTSLRVLLGPGRVAKEYVLGKRKSHVHPLKLLLAAIVVLLLVISQTQYLSSNNETLNKAVALVQSYSKWSFSLGIISILIASNLVFWRRQGFNFTEHFVLATYTQFVIIIANIINLSPLLIGTSPESVAFHRSVTGWYMDWVEAGIVFFAFGQFFAINWRRQWWWPMIGATVFFLAKEGLLYVYARAVIRIVLTQLS